LGCPNKPHSRRACGGGGVFYFGGKMRTTINDFQTCLELVDQRLEKYDVVKEKAWLDQTPMEHTSHAITHIALAEAAFEDLNNKEAPDEEIAREEVKKNLTAAALRTLMALHRFLEGSNELPDVQK
jgi:hypothetical protein